MLSRNFRLKFDLSNYDVFDIPDIKFCLMDTNSSVLHIQITNDGEIVDLSNMIVVMYVSKPDGTEVLIDGELEDHTEGIVKFTLPPQALIFASSSYFAEIRIVENGRCIITRPFNYQVVENLSSSDSQVYSSNEYVLLVDALSRLLEIETSESLRVANENIRILNEENRKISVDNMNASIDGKLNEMDIVKNEFQIAIDDKIGLVNRKVLEFTNTMDSIENSFNALAPEESTNAEVQLARTDITGYEHASIKNRLDKIETQPSIVWETVEG